MEDVTAGMAPVKSPVLGETWDGVLGVAPVFWGVLQSVFWLDLAPPALWFVVLKTFRSSQGCRDGRLPDHGVPEVLLPLFLAERRWLRSPVRLVAGSGVTGARRCHIPPVRALAGGSSLGGI